MIHPARSPGPTALAPVLRDVASTTDLKLQVGELDGSDENVDQTPVARIGTLTL